MSNFRYDTTGRMVHPLFFRVPARPLWPREKCKHLDVMKAHISMRNQSRVIWRRVLAWRSGATTPVRRHLPPCPNCGGESQVVSQDFGFQNGMNTMEIMLECKAHCTQKDVEIALDWQDA